MSPVGRALIADRLSRPARHHSLGQEMVEVGVLAFVQLCERLANPRFVVVGRSRCAHALRSLQLAALRVDLAMPALRVVWRSMPPLMASHGAEIASGLWGRPRNS
jgi:hypothetical protein